MTVLLVLTAGICLLAVFLPRMSEVSDSPKFGGETFYFLATAETTERTTAYEGAQSAAARGGAGFVYNDGSYKVIAAAYRNEADAKSLAAVNDGAFVVVFSIPPCSLGERDCATLEYVAGKFFDVMYDAATQLERGTMTDAAAELKAQAACRELVGLGDATESAALARAVVSSGEYNVPNGRTLSSYIRFLAVRALVNVADALSL